MAIRKTVSFGPQVKNMAILLRRPRFWLVSQMAAIVVASGLLGLLNRQFQPDSASYIAVSNMPLREALCSQRTLGYPLLLKAVTLASPNYALLPWVHLAMLFLATFLLDAAMRRFGASPWQALAVASGAMFGAIQQSWWIPAILTDLPALALAITCIGFLLWTVAEPRQPAVWCGLILSLAATYQVRPAYLFLIPLVPCLGIVLVYLHRKETGTPFQWKCLFLALVAASTVPYASYCLLRLLIVGHFGLVSFGGYTASGLAVELLDATVIENELSEHFRPLARVIIERRQHAGVKPAFRGGLSLDMRQWETNYCINVYKIAIPAASQIYGDDLTLQNQELAAFSKEIIRLHKMKYLLWIAYDFPRATAKVLYRSWFTWIFAPLLVALSVVRRRILRHPHIATNHESEKSRMVFRAVAWIAILFCLATLGLLVLSGVGGDSRNVVPAGVFVPSVILLAMVHQLTIIYESRCRNCECST